MNGYEVLYVAYELKINNLEIYFPHQKLKTEYGVINLTKRGSHYVCYYS